MTRRAARRRASGTCVAATHGYGDGAQNTKRRGCAALRSGSITVSKRSSVGDRARRRPAHHARGHHRRVADDGEEPAARLELLQPRIGQHRRRAGQHDRVVLPRRPSPARRHRCRARTLPIAAAPKLGARFARRAAASISTLVTSPARAREQRGEVAAAGADLEHRFVRAAARAPAARALPSWASTSARRRRAEFRGRRRRARDTRAGTKSSRLT